MRRILLSCAILGVLTLPAAAASASGKGGTRPGYLVVREAAGGGRAPVVTLVVQGFVLGSIGPQNQATVDIVQLPSKGGQGAPTAAGPDTAETFRWRGFVGHRFIGNGFRFRASSGYYRVVVHGSGVYLFAGGHGRVWLRGSPFEPKTDGDYSIDGGRFRSLPTHVLERRIGHG